MNALTEFLRRCLPAMAPVSAAEKARGALGALIGLSVVAVIGLYAAPAGLVLPALIPPLGASAVLLFAVPASPLAQPWPVLGGNTLAAAVGVTVHSLVPDPATAAPLAAAVAIALMFPLRCLHPPSGAVALTAVLGGPQVAAAGYGFVLWPVASCSLALLVAAIVFNRLSGRRYPHVAPAAAANVHGTADPVPTRRLALSGGDLDRVLRRHDEVLDVDRRDLEALFIEAELEASARRAPRLVVADIMSRDLATVAPTTGLRQAWAVLREHRLTVLPVVGAGGTYLGSVSQVDIAAVADFDPRRGFRPGLRRRIGRILRLERDPATTVGDIMTVADRAARPETPVAALVTAMADGGVHAMPVVDAADRLVGIVTQSDLIAALFAGSAGDADEGNRGAAGGTSS